MKLGLQIGYWSGGPPEGVPEQLATAERLGFDSAWFAESYGSDALTPLAWWGSQTATMRLGTSLVQLSARTPAATAMAAMTLDHLTGGRFVLGLGVSGPQVVEGWYGQPFSQPLARTREYVEVVRRIVRREGPVSFDGQHYPLPHPGGLGLGKALKANIHPLRTEIPIVLGAEGPKNIALAGEIADGWFPIFFSPRMDGWYRERLAEGFARPGARRTADDFEVIAFVPVLVGDDVEETAALMKPMLALYIGGMGAKEMNFHASLFERMGYEAEAAQIQDLYLAGRKDEAAAAVPTSLVEDVALVGPLDKIRADLDRWRDTCITTMLVNGPPLLLELVADVAGTSPATGTTPGTGASSVAP